MSVEQAKELLKQSEIGIPAIRQAALAQLHVLRAQQPGVVRQAALELGAQEVAAAGPAAGWSNWLGEQDSAPALILKPTTQAGLVGALREAVAQGKRVRAVASGHSTSAVARPDDGAVAVDLQGLGKILPRSREKTTLPAYATAGGAQLVRIQCGATVRDASCALLDNGLALANSGSYDGQQLMGALCTGTHGSGVGFQPLADMVVSLELAVVRANGSVQVVRIEPTDGITDPALYKRPLVQDDDAFRAAVISFGCFGVAMAMTIRVVPRFWMTETRTPTTWSAIRADLAAVATGAEHVDVHINPYEIDGEHAAVIIQRTAIPWQNDNPPDRPPAQVFVRRMADLFGSNLLGWFASNFPALVADGIEKYCQTGGSFVSSSSKVLITGYGNDIKATSSEFAVSLLDGVDMVDTVLAIARARRDGPASTRFRHSSPLGLRFVKRSWQRLSMHRDDVNATLEIPLVKGTKNAELALATYEAALPDARPHWGQVTDIDGARVQALYGDDWAKWKAQRDRFDPTKTFHNRFTAQLGL